MYQTIKYYGVLLLALLHFTACGQDHKNYKNSNTFNKMNETKTTNNDKQQVATIAAGCFWCIEAQFAELEGVSKVESGYIGGHVENPTYKEVCSGTTGHAEAINIYFDPTVISFDELLAAFWIAHDPTTLNRQGNDVGTQYRSAIFYHSDAQKQKAELYKQKLNDEKAFNDPIVTEIAPYDKFYVAENYHQDYYNNNPNQGYCTFVIKPKLDKFRKVFKDKLKEK